MKDTLVLGIGNLLLKDDGIGIHAVQQLQNEALPQNVEIIDGGTGGLDLLGYFMDFSRIIVIDALKGGNPPGTIYKIKPEDIPAYQGSNLSLHEVQILDVIQICKLSGANPQVIILGIEPADISYGLDLTEQLQRKLPSLLGLIKKEIGITNPTL